MEKNNSEISDANYKDIPAAIKKYEHLGKAYFPRKTSFKPYRSRALKFLKKYDEFERAVTGDLQDTVSALLLDKAEGKKVEDIIVQETVKDNPKLLKALMELGVKKVDVEESFLIEESNAKELCEIFFESNDINHNPDTEEEYNLYFVFMKGVLDDFFLKHRKQGVK